MLLFINVCYAINLHLQTVRVTDMSKIDPDCRSSRVGSFSRVVNCFYDITFQFNNPQYARGICKRFKRADKLFE
jgi:hypothetical protein